MVTLGSKRYPIGLNPALPSCFPRELGSVVDSGPVEHLPDVEFDRVRAQVDLLGDCREGPPEPAHDQIPRRADARPGRSPQPNRARAESNSAALGLARSGSAYYPR